MKHDRLSILRAQEAARLQQEKADASYVKAVGRSTRFRDDPYYAAAVVGFEAWQTLPTPLKIELVEAAGSTAPNPEEPKYWAAIKARKDTWQVGDIAKGSIGESYPSYWLPCDKDGWVTHDPQPDSTCPVPDGVKFEAKCRCGEITDLVDAASWQLGCLGDRTSNMFDIVAWRPVKS